LPVADSPNTHAAVLLPSLLLRPSFFLGSRDSGAGLCGQFEALASTATSLAASCDWSSAALQIAGGILNPGHELAAFRIQNAQLIYKGD
jgi:hypothetical protein